MSFGTIKEMFKISFPKKYDNLDLKACYGAEFGTSIMLEVPISNLVSATGYIRWYKNFLPYYDPQANYYWSTVSTPWAADNRPLGGLMLCIELEYDKDIITMPQMAKPSEFFSNSLNFGKVQPKIVIRVQFCLGVGFQYQNGKIDLVITPTAGPKFTLEFSDNTKVGGLGRVWGLMTLKDFKMWKEPGPPPLSLPGQGPVRWDAAGGIEIGFFLGGGYYSYNYG
jgi:hypothetical protein